MATLARALAADGAGGRLAGSGGGEVVCGGGMSAMADGSDERSARPGDDGVMGSAGRPTVAYIDAAALRHNFGLLRAAVGPAVSVMAVVKADAYGHGAPLVAHVLADAGADWFGVAMVGEAVELRRAGITQPILVLAGASPSEIDAVIEHRLSIGLMSVAVIRQLAERLDGHSVAVHIKLDTGMSRLGVTTAELDELCTLLRACPQLHVEGIFSHFAHAEDCRTPHADAQLAMFHDGLGIIRQAGFAPRWLHMANSVAALVRPDSHFNLVRPGIALYGIAPARTQPSATSSPARLQPVMRLATQIWQTKVVPAECPVGYGQTFITRRPSRLAVLPIGYADGYARGLSNRGAVLVRGERAPVVGSVCMDLTVVDVTDIPAASVGDEVVLWGRQGDAEIAPSEIADWQGAITYEVLSRVGKRVPRVMVDGGRV